MDEDYEERAGIMEYDGGLPREEAERKARQITSASKGAESATDGCKGVNDETNFKKG